MPLKKIINNILINGLEYSKTEKELIEKLEISGTKLLENYNKNNDLKISMKERNYCTYSALLWQEILVNGFNLYATVLALIDYRIINYKQKSHHYNQINNLNYNDYMEDLYIKRTEVAEELHSLINNDSICKSIIESINSMPCCKTFGDVSGEMEENETNLNIHMNFMQSYNNGFSLSSFVELEKILSIYDLIKEEIDITKKDNEEKLQRVKTKCINKKNNK